MVFFSYFGFLHNLQLASHDLAIVWQIIEIQTPLYPQLEFFFIISYGWCFQVLDEGTRPPSVLMRTPEATGGATVKLGNFIDDEGGALSSEEEEEKEEEKEEDLESQDCSENSYTASFDKGTGNFDKNDPITYGQEITLHVPLGMFNPYAAGG